MKKAQLKTASPITSLDRPPTKISNALTAYSPPALHEAASWLPIAATQDHLSAFAVTIYRELSPSTPTEIVRKTAQYLASRSYTVSEIVYALAMLPHDEAVAGSIEHRTPNPYWLLPHVARIIGRAREVRRLLAGRLIDEATIFELCREVPGLERSMFQRGGFDSFDNPLYRFAPGVVPSKEAEAMSLLHGRGNE